jgi:hypothetical protein
MRGTEYFVSFKTIVVITEEYNVSVNSGEMIGTAGDMTLYKMSYEQMSL